MIVAIALSGAKGVAAPALSISVAEARADLEAGRYEQAGRIAERAVVADPENGEAHLVLGLVRFRTQRYAEAVDAFEAAAHAARPIAEPVVAFNKGSAMFKAGQFETAEACFITAARDRKLAAVALLNAGLAALNSEAPDRARDHVALAERQPRAADLAGPLQDLRAQIKEEEDRLGDVRVQRLRTSARDAMNKGLWERAIAGYGAALAEARRLKRSNAELGELTYAKGVAQYRGGYFAESRATFNEAAALAPGEGEFEMMAAVAAVRLDEKLSARREFEEALRRGLSADDSDLIRSYLDALTPGLPARGRGVSLGAALALGYDSNVAQSGVGRTDTIANAGGSGFAEAALDIAWRFPVASRGFAEVAYNFDQTAFFDAVLDSFSLQQHTAELTGEVRATPWLRLALLTGADLLFSGLSTFSRFQDGLTVRPMLAVDEADRVSTRLEVDRSWKRALTDDFKHLGGVRTDVMLAQDVGNQRLRVTLAYRYRDEDLPNAERISLTALPNLDQIQPCLQVDTLCTYVIPYGYTSHAAILRASAALPRMGRLLLSASYERRHYNQDSYIEVPPAIVGFPGQTVHPSRRQDNRLGFTVAATLSRGSFLDATLRYDLIVNRSNVDNTVDRLYYDDKNFQKHVVTLEIARDWTWK